MGHPICSAHSRLYSVGQRLRVIGIGMETPNKGTIPPSPEQVISLLNHVAAVMGPSTCHNCAMCNPLIGVAHVNRPIICNSIIRFRIMRAGIIVNR